MGQKRNPDQSWTKEEEGKLRDFYRIRGASALARDMDRTALSIQCKARRMGLKTLVRGGGSSSLWTADEEKYLLRWYGTQGPGKTAKKLGRTKSAVEHKASELGVQFGDVKGWLPAGTVAAETGYLLWHVKHRAKAAGAFRSFKGLGKHSRRALVKADWAEEFIEESARRKDNARFADLWYDARQAARVLGYKLASFEWLLVSTHDRSISHAIQELTRKDRYRYDGEKNVGKWLFDPWEVETLARKVRDNVAIISQHQLMILSRIANGGEVALFEDEHGLTNWGYDDGNGLHVRVKKSAVRRLIEHGLVVERDDSLLLEITDRGREELESHGEL